MHTHAHRLDSNAMGTTLFLLIYVHKFCVFGRTKTETKLISIFLIRLALAKTQSIISKNK